MRDINWFVQACGKPVIAGASGGTRETMNIPHTGLILPCETPEPLASTITELLLDSARRETMGHAAREWIVNRFDWSRLATDAAHIFGLTLNTSDNCNPANSSAILSP